MIKKLLGIIVILSIISVLSGCHKKAPGSPVFINAPSSTRTVSPTITHTPTISPTHTISPTFTITPTATDIPYSDLVTVSAGVFMQADGTDSFSHTISVFKIGKYEVTYDLWYLVYKWGTERGYSFQNSGHEGNSGNAGIMPTGRRYEPVTEISWRDAIVWCNAYSEMSGLPPFYCSDAGLSTPVKSSVSGAFGSSINTAAGSFDNPYVNWYSGGFRLPTEGEWQYAARYKDGVSWIPYDYASGASGDTTNASATGAVGWYGANSGGQTHAAGGKAANGLGIYDMSGNIWEWCWDWMAAYPGASVDYKGPASGLKRMGLNASYGSYDAMFMRVSERGHYDPYDFGGFRVARSN